MIGRRRRACRAGLALLPVLAILAGGAAVGIVVAGLAREVAGAADNRIALRRASWRAEGCVQAVVAGAADVVMRPEPTSATAWTSLDSTLVLAPDALEGCICSLHPQGERLPINLATTQQIRDLLSFAGIDALRAESLAAALVDWRDSDDVVRPDGAESQWYRTAGRALPRNAPLADVEELLLVRGFGDPRVPWRWLSATDARLYVARAPAEVLASVLGTAPQDIRNLRVSLGRPLRAADVRDWVDARRMHPRASPMLPDSAPRVTLGDEPEAWIAACESKDGLPAVGATVELAFARSGPRIAVLRQRTWP